MHALKAWFLRLPAWQRVAAVAVAVACAVLIGLRLWDALGAFVAALFGLGGGGGAVKMGRRAVTARKAAKAAAGLGEAIAEAAEAHAESDAGHDAAGRAADAAVVEARHAKAPEDPTEPMRSRYLGER